MIIFHVSACQLEFVFQNTCVYQALAPHRLTGALPIGACAPKSMTHVSTSAKYAGLHSPGHQEFLPMMRGV